MLFLLGTGGGGFLGAVARYYLGVRITARWKDNFPLGTLLINITGSLIICFLLGLSHHSFSLPPLINTAVTTGFLGAFTTFSTFSYESVQLFEQGKWIIGWSYICVTLIFGLLLGWLGYQAGINIY